MTDDDASHGGMQGPSPTGAHIEALVAAMSEELVRLRLMACIDEAVADYDAWTARLLVAVRSYHQTGHRGAA